MTLPCFVLFLAQDHDDLYPTLGITQAMSGQNLVWTKTGEEESGRRRMQKEKRKREEQNVMIRIHMILLTGLLDSIHINKTFIDSAS